MLRNCPNCNSTKLRKLIKGKKRIIICLVCGFYNEVDLPLNSVTKI